MQTESVNGNYVLLTFLATKRTINRARAKHPAAILAARRFVDAIIKTIPQNEEPRSGNSREHHPNSVEENIVSE